VKKWILWLGGALLAVALAILGRDARTVRRLERAACDPTETDDDAARDLGLQAAGCLDRAERFAELLAWLEDRRATREAAA
jgi:hypothetical protein